MNLEHGSRDLRPRLEGASAAPTSDFGGMSNAAVLLNLTIHNVTINKCMSKLSDQTSAFDQERFCSSECKQRISAEAASFRLATRADESRRRVKIGGAIERPRLPAMWSGLIVGKWPLCESRPRTAGPTLQPGPGAGPAPRASDPDRDLTRGSLTADSDRDCVRSWATRVRHG